MADPNGVGGNGGQMQGSMPQPRQGHMPQYAQQAAYGTQQLYAATARHQSEQLAGFWQQQAQEIAQVGTDPAEFKNHQLPLARIKKIMKSDEDVRMISAEAPVLFAKACEMFILELTLRSWSHSEENKRRTLQRNDIAAAITRTDIFDFLVDIVPREERGDDGVPRMPQGMPGGAPPLIGNPYMQQPGAPGGMDPSMMYQAGFQMMAPQQWQQHGGMPQATQPGDAQQQQQQQQPQPQPQHQQQQQQQQQQ